MFARTSLLSGVLCCMVIVSSSPIKNNDIDEDTVDSIDTNVMFAEFDYEEKCQDLAKAEWNLLVHGGRPQDMESKAEALKQMAAVQRFNAKFLHDFWSDNQAGLPSRLQTRLDLAEHPGDMLLKNTTYLQMLNYSLGVEEQYYAQRIPCSQNLTEGCQIDINEVRRVLAESGDAAQLLHVWKHWHEELKPSAEEFRSFLDLEKEAATTNEAENVATYWQQLQDLDDSYERVEDLWAEVKPLYDKLHLYVSRWLEHNYGTSVVGTPTGTSNLPAHVLGSLLGEDWSSLIDLVISPTDTTLSDIEQALENKKVQNARSLYGLALDSLSGMGLSQMANSKFFSGVLYSGSCPARTVRFCEDGQVKVLTCQKVGLPQLADAYATATRVLHSHLAALDSRHILRETVRYSALTDAVPGMVGLVATSPYHLAHLGLLSANAAFSESPQGQTLLLLVALGTLPKLAYYMAADKWRLELLENNVTTAAQEWRKFRMEYQRVVAPDSSDEDFSFLSDPHITSNKPYLGKFAAIIHQFQLLEYLTEDDPENPVLAIKEKDELNKLMMNGQSQRYPDLAVLPLSTDAILRYFEPLESYLNMSIAEIAPKEVRESVVEVAATIRVAQQSDALIENEELGTEEEVTEVPEDILGDGTLHDIAVENSTEVVMLSVNVSNVSEAPVNNVSLSQMIETETEIAQTALPGANTAILFVSLVVFGLALAAGFFVAGKRYYKRRYRRNRRPSNS